MIQYLDLLRLILNEGKAKAVFNSTSMGRYADYIVNAGVSGAGEIDRFGRRNMVCLPETGPALTTGTEYSSVRPTA